jgi:hypothetical protein
VHRLFSFAQNQYSTPPEYPHATPHTGKNQKSWVRFQLSIVYSKNKKKIKEMFFGDINYIE